LSLLLLLLVMVLLVLGCAGSAVMSQFIKTFKELAEFYRHLSTQVCACVRGLGGGGAKQREQQQQQQQEPQQRQQHTVQQMQQWQQQQWQQHQQDKEVQQRRKVQGCLQQGRAELQQLASRARYPMCIKRQRLQPLPCRPQAASHQHV
jgi:predicted PurR-regulated permease PerM